MPAAPDQLFADAALNDMLFHERRFWQRGAVVAGIDEAGRGCLAGPVVAAAVVLPRKIKLPGVTDSKALTDEQRRAMLPLILDRALAIGVGVRSARRIDATDILVQTKQAMLAAVAKLGVAPDVLLIDGNQRIPTLIEQHPLVKGDSLSLSIAAASIIAKVTRDDIMLALHARFPQYNWNENKGYGTRKHYHALGECGPCALHRLTFRGVCECEE